MKFSKSFIKTSKDNPNQETSNNAKLLIRAGFINKTMAGVYSYLPLGLKVLNNIENKLRDHLNSIGAQELFLSALSPKDVWKKTDRWEIDEYFKVPSQSNSEYRINPTHEEIISPIVSDFVNSYKNIRDYDKEKEIYPLSLYQIQSKFRDEVRAKAGIMRGREFRMKDMYDFHRTKESFEEYFDLVTRTYHEFFQDIGLKTYTVNASGGVFSEKMSREFQCLCEAGEDWVYIDPTDDSIAYNQEVAPCVIKFDESADTIMKPYEEKLMKGVIGAKNLADEIGIKVSQTVKTIYYEDEGGKLIAAAVRGDREISEEKLQKLYGKSLTIASEELVKKITGASLGYAGLINLPESVILYVDNSLEKLKNFETGSNKDDHHSINVNFVRDVPMPETFYDIKEAIQGDVNPSTGSEYIVKKGSEVGNIFDLGQKWVKAFDINYIDENNQKQYPYMGCHGIGTSRCMGVVAEVYSDEKGLKWPKSIAPFQYHIITHLTKDELEINEKIIKIADKLYNGVLKLIQNESGDWKIIDPSNIEDITHYTFEEIENMTKKNEILWDDREGVGIGSKFKDADLIGIPYQVIITKRTIESGDIVEVKER